MSVPSIHAMIIITAAQKGGSGKSTIATNIAALLSHSSSVVLLDLDSQATSAKWIMLRRQTNMPAVDLVQEIGNANNKDVAAKHFQRADKIRALAQTHDHVVIDVGGRDSDELRSAMMIADVALFPFTPSWADLSTAPHMSKIACRVKERNAGLQVFALLNQCPTNPLIREAADSHEYLAADPGITLLDNRVHSRKVYRDAMSAGYGVVESANTLAGAEIRMLVSAIGLRKAA